MLDDRVTLKSEIARLKERLVALERALRGGFRRIKSGRGFSLVYDPPPRRDSPRTAEQEAERSETFQALRRLERAEETSRPPRLVPAIVQDKNRSAHKRKAPSRKRTTFGLRSCPADDLQLASIWRAGMNKEFLIQCLREETPEDLLKAENSVLRPLAPSVRKKWGAARRKPFDKVKVSALRKHHES